MNQKTVNRRQPFCQTGVVAVALFILFVVPLTGKSQDVITVRNGKQIECTITKIDSSIIYYDFVKGNRQLSSFIDKNNVRSYEMQHTENRQKAPGDSLSRENNETVVIDTSKYVEVTQRWVNLVTYSQRYGVHAKGWSVNYYGFLLRNTAKWMVPVAFGVEGSDINQDYFDRSGYSYLKMSYMSAGISPFYKLNENVFLNLGAQLLFGEEELQDFSGRVSSHTIVGIAPSQGIYFMPRSKFGFVAGISVYEKLLSSKVYKNDIGVKFEIGLKF